MQRVAVVIIMDTAGGLYLLLHCFSEEDAVPKFYFFFFMHTNKFRLRAMMSETKISNDILCTKHVAYVKKEMK